MIWLIFKLKPMLPILPITKTSKYSPASVSIVSVMVLRLFLYDGLHLCDPAKVDSLVAVSAFSSEGASEPAFARTARDRLIAAPWRRSCAARGVSSRAFTLDETPHNVQIPKQLDVLDVDLFNLAVEFEGRTFVIIQRHRRP